MSAHESGHLTLEDLRDSLQLRFPWLATDESANGADTVDAVKEWHAELTRQITGNLQYDALVLREPFEVATGKLAEFLGVDPCEAGLSASDLCELGVGDLLERAGLPDIDREVTS